jgi:hypothetical protein
MEGFHFVQTFINSSVNTIETVSYTGIYQFLQNGTENILIEKPFEIIHTFYHDKNGVGVTKTISYYFVETGLTEEEKLFLIKDLQI